MTRGPSGASRWARPIEVGAWVLALCLAALLQRAHAGLERGLLGLPLVLLGFLCATQRGGDLAWAARGASLLALLIALASYPCSPAALVCGALGSLLCGLRTSDLLPPKRALLLPPALLAIPAALLDWRAGVLVGAGLASALLARSTWTAYAVAGLSLAWAWLRPDPALALAAALACGGGIALCLLPFRARIWRGKPMAARALRQAVAGAETLTSRWFPGVSDPWHEALRAGAARIGLGFCLALRAGLLCYGTYQADYPPLWRGLSAEFLSALAWLVLALLLSLGILTPVVLTLLVALSASFDQTIGTSTLGTQVLVCGLLALLWANAGRRLSLDALALRGQGTFSRWLRSLYGLWGAPDARTYRLALGYGVAAFALLHLLALGYHLLDPAWRGGATISTMLVNSYVSRFYSLFREAEAAFPSLYRAQSVAGIWAQSLWQGGMLLLLSLPRTRRFAIAWGAVFIGGSIFLLHLSYLPFVEVVLWTWFFLPRPKPAAQESAASSEPTPGDHQDQDQGQGQDQGGVRITPPSRGAWVVVWFLTLAALAVTSAPYVGLPVPAWQRSLVHRFGLSTPNVFNATDLRMADQWFRAERLSAEGASLGYVPLNGAEGERGIYFAFDNLLYGADVAWRRAQVPQERSLLGLGDAAARARIERVLRFDASVQGRLTAGPARYRVSVFSNAQSDPTRRSEEGFAPILRHSEVLEVSAERPDARAPASGG